MTTYIVFAAILASLLLYAWIAAQSARQSRANPDAFYLAQDTVSAPQFAMAQTAYQLQMATIYPFFTFAFSGQWWLAALNTLFYMVGILLYLVCAGRFHSGRANLLGSSSTVHAAIGNVHASSSLRVFTAVLTILAFTGLAAFEIVWGATALRVVFRGGMDLYYLTTAVLAAYLVMYVNTGGQPGNLRASEFQLLLCYLGLHSLVAWSALKSLPYMTLAPLRWLAMLIIGCSVVMFAYRIWVRRGGNGIVNLLTMTSVVGMVLLIGWTILSKASGAAVPPTPFSQAMPLGILAAISVSVLPLTFQFVDMTNWQRIAALRANPANLVKQTRLGLVQYLLESPLSWLLPIFLGLAASTFVHAGTGDKWMALLQAVLLQSGLTGTVFAAIVFVGLIAVFMSTADELLAAIGYAFAYDVARRSRVIVDAGHRRGKPLSAQDTAIVFSYGRPAIWCSLAIIISAFIYLGNRFGVGVGQTFIGGFLACYAPLAAMAPALMIPGLFGRAASRTVAWLSIAIGAFSGLFFGIWSIFDPDALHGAVNWLAPIVSMGLAWIIYLGGMAVAPTAKQHEMAEESEAEA